LSYPDDESAWGREECYDALIYDMPELIQDATFQSMFDDLFVDSLDNWDDAHDAFDALDAYLDEYYDLDIDEYFDWEDWRAEHEFS
jgi:hypothetical protein